MLERNGILKIANVGDCGLRVIREGNNKMVLICATLCALSLILSSELAGKVYFSTSPQEHYFNCPFQLSSQAFGQTYRDAVVIILYPTLYDCHLHPSHSEFFLMFYYESTSDNSGDIILDSPFQLQLSTVELKEGDTIVMGSDGLFDNVFDHEIVSTLTGYRDVAEAGRCF